MKTTNFKKVISLFVIFLSLTLMSCAQKEKSTNNEKDKKVNYVDINSTDNKLLKHFKDNSKDIEILKAGMWDVSGDDLEDLVIIFKKDKDKNSMVIVKNSNDQKFEISNEVPAPISDQKIEFKDIDSKNTMEIIVSGSKNGKFGYAIFRLEDGTLIDLFGDKMKDCC